MERNALYEGQLHKVRQRIKRFTFAILIVLSFGAMLLGKADTIIVEKVRSFSDDLLEPIFSVLSKPTAAMLEVWDSGVELINIKKHNEKLREENRKLKQWYHLARHYKNENKQLRKLLNYVDDTEISYVSARVIAEHGGAFARSVITSADENHGVKVGNAVFTGEGLAGRVAAVGINTSRILLITDINSRIPVLVEGSRERAILSGNNTDILYLNYLARTANVMPGDVLVTSGIEGVFPPGIPVGMVYSISDENVLVQPFVDFNRLEYVRIVDYGLRGLIEAEN